jgi:putative ABC transport system substrate-binding protein
MSANFAEFRKGLAEFGWVEGRNIRIDYRWYAGDGARFSNDAADLVGLSPDLIVANGGAAVGRLLQTADPLFLWNSTVNGASCPGWGILDCRNASPPTVSLPSIAERLAVRERSTADSR